MVTLYSRIALFVSIITSVLCFLSFNYSVDYLNYNVSFWLDAIGTFLLLFLAIRSLIRWSAIFKINQQQGIALSRVGWIKSVTYEGVLWIFKIIIFIFLTLYFQEGLLFRMALLLYVLESVAHLIFGKSRYKLVVTKNALTLVNHSLLVIRWSDVSSITKRHEDFQFKLKSGKVRLVDLDLIRTDDKLDFEQKIKDIAFSNNIYFS